MKISEVLIVPANTAKTISPMHLASNFESTFVSTIRLSLTFVYTKLNLVER